MDAKKPQLIVALDVNTLKEAETLVDVLSPAVSIFKVGSQLFTACGREAVHFLLSCGKKVFLDLKYHDIPNTVASAVAAAVQLKKGKQGVFMLSVHALGGKAMLQAAALRTQEEARRIGITKPLIIAITVLTSEEKNDNIHLLVLQRALLAKEAGCDGVVASADEAKIIRQEVGEDFIIVTPGVRPGGADSGDQKRIATPQEAAASGSNFLVVGRPIIQSKNPLESARKILDEIKK